MKQWGQTPEEIDPAVTERVPVLISYDNRYFQEPYQGMPLDGYTPMFKAMLDHPGIRVMTGVDARTRLSFEGEQVFFDGKPDADTRAELKSSGFRWAPSVGAWQRQLTDNAIRAADRLECIKPLSGEKPSQLQKKPSILQTMREQGEKVQTEPEKKAPSGRDAER